MPFPKETHHTAADYWALPDGQRAELIDGTLYDMTPPGFSHQRLVMRLSSAIDQYIIAHGGPCQVVPAPFAVNLDADDSNWVEPDISVICDPQKITDRGCVGTPDWIIEVVSPGSRKMDYSIKCGKYGSAGVSEYWVVDPTCNRVTVYRFNGDHTPQLYTFEQPVQSGLYDDFVVTIAELLRQ